LNHHRDEIGVVERGGGLGVVGIGEAVIRRPQLPQQAAKRAAMLRQPGDAALGVKIPLVPVSVLGGGGLRLAGGGNVLDIVAGDRDETADPLGPQRGDHASRATTPIVTGEDRKLQIERVDKV